MHSCNALRGESGVSVWVAESHPPGGVGGTKPFWSCSGVRTGVCVYGGWGDRSCNRTVMAVIKRRSLC
jgi:hypothetical protein